MIAIVPEDASPNVFFELGLAHALKKPLLVLISPSFGRLPSDLSNTLYVRTDLKNREPLAFALDQCLGRIEKPAGRAQKLLQEGAPLGDEATRFLSALRQKGYRISGQELEGLVAEVFRAAGVEAVIESNAPDAGADIAIWSDALQLIAGNPILVEVKGRLRSQKDLVRALEQTERYRERSGAKLAILVFNATLAALSALPFTGSVLAVAIADLVEHLRTKTLAETIRELRNETAHRGGA